MDIFSISSSAFCTHSIQISLSYRNTTTLDKGSPSWCLIIHSLFQQPICRCSQILRHEYWWPTTQHTCKGTWQMLPIYTIAYAHWYLLGNVMVRTNPMRNRKSTPKVKGSKMFPRLHKWILKVATEGSAQWWGTGLAWAKPWVQYHKNWINNCII